MSSPSASSMSQLMPAPNARSLPIKLSYPRSMMYALETRDTPSAISAAMTIAAPPRRSVAVTDAAVDAAQDLSLQCCWNRHVNRKRPFSGAR